MKVLKRVFQGFSALIALLLIILLASLLIDSYQTTYLKIEKQPEADKKSYFIKNVNIIPMSSDTVLSNSSIKIINGVIISIGDIFNPENLTEIDGMNYFLSPGLIDMHVHVWDQYELGLYLANGVTTIRNLWGQPMHLRMKKDIIEEDIIAPIFFTSSPKLTGPEFIGDDNLNLTEPADAKEKVISYQERGYDFIKTYYGLTENLFEAILEQADISNMDIVAHPSQKVPYSYHFDQSESGRLNGSDKNLYAIPLNSSGFEAGVKCVSPGIIHNCALGIFSYISKLCLFLIISSSPAIINTFAVILDKSSIGIFGWSVKSPTSCFPKFQFAVVSCS